MNEIKTTINKAPEGSESPVANIYLIYSPLHYLAAESIALNLEKNARNFLFFLKPEFEKLVDQSKWNATAFLPWPRFYPEKGFFGRMRRTKNNLAAVEKVCSGALEIRLHTPVIDTEAVNYFINSIQYSHPGAKFLVRLIPDGLLNIQRYPMGLLKEMLQYFKKLRRLLHPTLNYYTFSGDRIGSDAKIVDRIYTLRGFPHEYDLAKTVEISLFHLNVHPIEETTVGIPNKRALVIGQDLIACKLFSVKDMHSVTLGIRALIAACGINDITYKLHPRDQQRELSHPDYKELVIDEPLETYMASNNYDLVISVVSTALLTARMILPDSCRVIAYGMNILKYRSERNKKNVESTFISLGIEMVNHSLRL